jgi:hypothetical protein
MEVRIGVVYTTRELSLETEESAEQIAAAVDSAISAGDSLLWLTDTKGRRIGVPVEKIAYVEVAADAGGRKVGFGAG